MAIYPGATKRLIPHWNEVHITNHRRVNIHVAVSNRDDIYGLFANSMGACSHFYVNREGEVFQYIDTKYRSASDYHGNDSTFSVENEGGVRNPNGETMTKAQLVANAKLWAWLRDTHDIPNKMAKNTQSNANSSGLSWHRLGVVGNFAGRGGILEVSYEPGGILYSKARGKECPGDAKILQIEQMFELADGKRWNEIGEKEVGKVKPVKKKPSKIAPQSPSNTPNGSTNFPDDYVDLRVQGNFKSWEIGALQIILHNIFGNEGLNKQWDGKFERLTITDTMSLLQRNGYYLETQWERNGVPKGTKLVKDGDDGYWFWVEFQRMLGNDEGNRRSGKVFYDLDKFRLDGDPGKETYKGIQRWLNASN